MKRRCTMIIAVHPHGCGERYSRCQRINHISGSSPRVWGTPLLSTVFESFDRFIPTGVGNAREPRGNVTESPVHPHGCGERAVEAVLADAHGRFIPTGVGNARYRGPADDSPAVHPHGCGERDTVADDSHPPAGSSPRVWGTLFLDEFIGRLRRFIPTGVGNARPRPGRISATAVHPHGCGERTNHNRLISKRKIRLKNSTDFYAVVGVWQVSDF